MPKPPLRPAAPVGRRFRGLGGSGVFARQAPSLSHLERTEMGALDQRPGLSRLTAPLRIPNETKVCSVTSASMSIMFYCGTQWR